MATTVIIPAELRERPQWVLWRYVERDGKTTKVPYRAASPGREATTIEPATWATFECAEAKLSELGVDGIGFVFTADDPYTGIDLDDCITDDGEIESWAAEVIEKLGSYAERTPSGRGLHVIVRGELRGTRRRAGGFEVYSEGRYFTMTGERVGQRETIEERQAELDAVVARMLPERFQLSPTPGRGTGLVTADDQELLDKAFAAQGGGELRSLYNGALNGYGDDESRADLALCGRLAFWTGPEPDRIDRLFRESRLMRPKWDSRRGETTYGRMTIEKALAGRTEFYEARSQTPFAPLSGLRGAGTAARRGRTSASFSILRASTLRSRGRASWGGG